MKKRLILATGFLVTTLVFFGFVSITGAQSEDMDPALREPASTETTQTGAEDVPSGTSTVARFQNATEVNEGDVVDGILSGMSTDIFKISLNPGYQVKVSGTASMSMPDDNSKIIVSLYDAEGELLSLADAPADGQTKADAFYYRGMGANQTGSTYPPVYVEVTNEAAKDSGSISYTVNFEKIDRSDAFLNTDAGASIDEALELNLKNVENSFAKNFLGLNICGTNQYCSSDETDFYMLSLSAGDLLEFIVTPSSELDLTLTLYEADGTIIETASGGNKGAPVEISYAAEKGEDVYAEISSSAQSFFGAYGVEANISEAQVVASPIATPQASVSDDSGVDDDSQVAGFNIWDYKYYIIGGVVLVVLVVIVVLLTMRKKKNQIGSKQKEVEQMRAQLRSGKNSASPNIDAPGATQTMQDHMKQIPSRKPKVEPKSKMPTQPPANLPKSNRPSPAPVSSPKKSFGSGLPKTEPSRNIPKKDGRVSSDNIPTKKPMAKRPDGLPKKADHDIDDIFGPA